MTPSRKRSLVRSGAIVVGAIAIGAPAILLAKSLAKERAAARDRSADISAALDRRAELVRQLAAKNYELHTQQLAAIAKIDALHSRLEARDTCDDLLPTFRQGVGILQVGSVRETRGSKEDIGEFGTYQVNLVRQLLWLRGVREWSPHLGHYSGADKIGSIRRIVFREVDPGAGRAMCAWLRCEKWTGGCGFVDEKGSTDTPDEPQQFQPTEDLYGLFIAQRSAPTPRRPL